MRNFLLIILIAFVTVSCGKDNEEINYLTSWENVDRGLIGDWEAQSGYFKSIQFVDANKAIVEYSSETLNTTYKTGKKEEKDKYGNVTSVSYHITINMWHGLVFSAKILKLTSTEMQLNNTDDGNILTFTRK